MRDYKTLKKIRSQDQNSGEYNLSVLVRVKNEAEQLPRFITSVKNQIGSEHINFIFLDSGSKDQTLEILMAENCDLYKIESSEFSFGDSCNLMMNLSCTELNIFFSGHVLLEGVTFITDVLELYNKVGFFSGYFRQVVNEFTGYSIYDKTFLKYYFPKCSTPSPSLLNKNYNFSNAGSIVSRSHWKQIEFMDIIASEDQLFADQVVKKYGGVYYFHALNIKHSHDESLDSITHRVNINVLARNPDGVPFYKHYVSFLKVFLSLYLNSFNLKESIKFAKAHSNGYIIK